MTKFEVREKGLSDEEAYNLLAIASKAIGNDFFRTMAEALANLLQVRWVMVSMIERQDSTNASAIVAWDNGPADPFDYELAGSPCENILTQCACAYPENVQTLFPKDQLLIDMGAQGYVGVPLYSSSGKVLGLLAVLHNSPITNHERASKAIELFAGRAGAELERLTTISANERLGRIVENSVSEAFIFSADTFKFALVNKGARDNLGYTMDELQSLTPWDIKPEYSEEEFKRAVAPLISGEIPDLQFDTIHSRKDGTTYKVSVRLQYFCKPDNIFFASITDTTDKSDAEERERILVREVNHRSKNLLTLVQIIARQTTARDPVNFVEKLEHRIRALASNQDVLVHNYWTDIPFEDLVRSQLAHFDGLLNNRIRLDGPELLIKSTPAQAIGMAVHELATNAAKYGALSNETGVVDVYWSLKGPLGSDQTVAFEWIEKGGPEVSKPADSGFGTAILERQMIGMLGATVALDYQKSGMHYRVSAPADRVVEKIITKCL